MLNFREDIFVFGSTLYPAGFAAHRSRTPDFGFGKSWKSSWGKFSFSLRLTVTLSDWFANIPGNKNV